METNTFGVETNTFGTGDKLETNTPVLERSVLKTHVLKHVENACSNFSHIHILYIHIHILYMYMLYM